MCAVRRFVVLALAVPAFIACGADRRDLEDLPRPVLSWEHKTGACSSLRAVDGAGELWGNGGCDGDDLKVIPMRTLTEAERMVVGATLVELRSGRVGSSGSCLTASWHRFVDQPIEGGQVRKWHVCGGASQPTDPLSDLPEPFMTIAKTVSD
jgi:hypothetical protein